MVQNTQAILDAIQQGGVVGEGGAGFPAHVKYNAQIETVIANGCECEPLLYTDQHIMQAHTKEIVRGMQAVMTVTGASRGVIGIKRKYTEIAKAFTEAISGIPEIELALLDNFYPAGDEQTLVYEVTGITIPPLGLPKDANAVVANVGSLYSVSNALAGTPVTHKYVTVTGEVAKPAVIRVPVGTSVQECITQCGGVTVADPVYVMGGPMMGRFIDTQDELEKAVITKTGGGIIVLPRGHHLHRMGTLSPATMQKQAAAACIQCRYCTDLCPRYLIGQGFETHRVMRAFGAGADVAMGAMQAHMCCECGVCELFSCPMGISPRRVNALLKSTFREKGITYQGERKVIPEQRALRPYRKLPVPRLGMRIGIDEYMSLHPEFTGDYTPASVRIPLHQHIGAPAQATVKVGDTVTVGDCIGTVPADKLGATIHASISGIVTDVSNTVTIKGA